MAPITTSRRWFLRTSAGCRSSNHSASASGCGSPKPGAFIQEVFVESANGRLRKERLNRPRRDPLNSTLLDLDRAGCLARGGFRRCGTSGTRSLSGATTAIATARTPPPVIQRRWSASPPRRRLSPTRAPRRRSSLTSDERGPASYSPHSRERAAKRDQSTNSKSAQGRTSASSAPEDKSGTQASATPIA